MINESVLVLNQNYEPLNICNVRRALVLVDKGKAELLMDGRGSVQTVSHAFPLPSVIRLVYMVRRPLGHRRLARREVFERDHYTCQYCGTITRELTLDHIIPRVHSGPHAWENVVSACVACNHRKAGRTPKEAHMRLMARPQPPKPNPYYLFTRRRLHEEWKQFIPWVE
jgi:5-methylcytosine-specific restriction endonuclease McrA